MTPDKEAVRILERINRDGNMGQPHRLWRIAWWVVMIGVVLMIVVPEIHCQTACVLSVGQGVDQFPENKKAIREWMEQAVAQEGFTVVPCWESYEFRFFLLKPGGSYASDGVGYEIYSHRDGDRLWGTVYTTDLGSYVHGHWMLEVTQNGRYKPIAEIRGFQFKQATIRKAAEKIARFKAKQQTPP